MTPQARAKVKSLIALDERYKTFAMSCNWPDDPRIRSSEHYVNLDRGAAKLTEVCPEAYKCVVCAILNDARDLALRDDDPEQQLELLKSLGHWVGDLHQPLHVSFADDQGANKIATDDPCNATLHSVWDGCIEETVGEDTKAVAIDLRAEITDAERTAWVPATIDAEAVMAWANESFAVTISLDVRYCVKNGTECWYDEGKRLYTGGPRKRVNADEAYLKAQSPIVRERIKQGGVRLAAILNTLFADVDVAGLEEIPPGSVVAPVAPPVAAAPTTVGPGEPEPATPEARLTALRIDAIEAQIRALTAELELLRSE